MTLFTEPYNQNLSDLLRLVESSGQTGLHDPQGTIVRLVVLKIPSPPTRFVSNKCRCCRRALRLQADGHRIRSDVIRGLRALVVEMKWAQQQVSQICDRLRSQPSTAHLSSQVDIIEEEFMSLVKERMMACADAMGVEIVL